MKHPFRNSLLILTLLGLFACAPAPAGGPAADSTPRAVPGEIFYPLSTRTGLPEIDGVLEAVEKGEAEGLRSLMEFAVTKCTTREGFGGPPKCRAGEADGSPVEAFPFIGSEGGMLRKEEMANWPGLNVAGLYAVYQVSPEVFVEPYYPAGEYAILFVGRQGQAGIAVRLSAGRIVRLDTVFGEMPGALDALLTREARGVTLGPPER